MGNNGNNGNKNLIEALQNSKLYQEYARAFSETTNMPVCLRPVDSWQLPLHGHKNESPFCGMMTKKSRSCAACLQIQQKLAESATRDSQTVVCFAGMSDTAVPVRLGDHLLGFLQTGQVFKKKPSQIQWDRISQLTDQWGVPVNPSDLKSAFQETRVVGPKQYESSVKLLNIFAQHLSMVSNQVVVQQQNSEPPTITRAKEFIVEHQAEDLSLGEVAKAVSTSTFYFCKMFKKSTGLNFTNYLSRIRIERAKNLLLNPNLRVSEIAFEVSFQSLTHFNRVFKRIIGQSPTEYRDKLVGSGIGT